MLCFNVKCVMMKKLVSIPKRLRVRYIPITFILSSMSIINKILRCLIAISSRKSISTCVDFESQFHSIGRNSTCCIGPTTKAPPVFDFRDTCLSTVDVLRTSLAKGTALIGDGVIMGVYRHN